jgi:hypothetical protein
MAGGKEDAVGTSFRLVRESARIRLRRAAGWQRRLQSHITASRWTQTEGVSQVCHLSVLLILVCNGSEA